MLLNWALVYEEIDSLIFVVMPKLFFAYETEQMMASLFLLSGVMLPMFSVANSIGFDSFGLFTTVSTYVFRLR